MRVIISFLTPILTRRFFVGTIALLIVIGSFAYAATVDGNTVLLIHADGADATTVFSDVSGKTVTTNGNAQVDTAQSKFGGASAIFDNSDDYLSVAANAAWNTTGTDYTIDAWVRFNSVGTNDTVVAGGSSGHWFVYTYSDGRIGVGKQGTNEIMAAAGTVTTGTWYHLAIVRVNSTGRTDIYINGTSVANATTDWTTDGSANALTIGSRGTTDYFDGWIDELRISKGIARWTANFTPPTTEYAGGITLTNNIKVIGNLYVTGAISKGAGTFVIDHPLKPFTHLLFHSFVESPDAKNIYDGVATLDENGEVAIQLPDYFEALNKDFRYQFFPHYEAMPDLYVKEEVKNNQFVIAGGKPNGEISWQVSGTRHDPYILANPIVNEVEKSSETEVDRGECLFEPLCEE